jgi:CheY-like chemotaxis protein
MKEGESLRLEATAVEYPMRILVVDDQELNRQLLGSMLTYFGYDFQTACNGREALEICQKTGNDCILMDVNMPEMDGVEATRLIRAWEATLGAKSQRVIVAITANMMMGDREQFLASGMDLYMSKPLKIREVRALLIDCFCLLKGRPIDGKG